MIRIARLNLKPEHAPPRQGEIKESYANIDKVAKQLLWKPETALEEGLKLRSNSNL